MLLDAQVEITARVAYITRITRITLKFIHNALRRQLSDLGKKIDRVIQPVFTSRKISEGLKAKETKPSLANQQYDVYEFQCNSCDSNYIGYTSRQLHLRSSRNTPSSVNT